jgi:hypothetical protein
MVLGTINGKFSLEQKNSSNFFVEHEGTDSPRQTREPLGKSSWRSPKEEILPNSDSG